MKTAKIIGIVRYSILTDNRVKKGWTISKKLSFRDLEKEIFCPERLLNRGLLFSRLTLPSLNANVRDWANLKVVVVTSLDLPSWHMIELESICKAYPFVKIIKINTEASAFNEAVNKYIDDETSEDETYFTFRIDDDDALSNDFIEIIRPYLNKSFAGTAISLPLGYSGLFNTKKRIVTQYGETYSILNAQALGFISSTKCKKSTFLILEPDTEELTGSCLFYLYLINMPTLEHCIIKPACIMAETILSG